MRTLLAARRTPQTDRLQLEASRIAVELQTIGNRFENLRMNAVAQRVHKAADETALAVFAMGTVRTIDDGTFIQCFPHLWRAAGYPSQSAAEDDE